MAGDLCGFEDGQAGWNAELYAVDCDVYHFVCSPFENAVAEVVAAQAAAAFGHGAFFR